MLCSILVKWGVIREGEGGRTSCFSLPCRPRSLYSCLSSGFCYRWHCSFSRHLENFLLWSCVPSPSTCPRTSFPTIAFPSVSCRCPLDSHHFIRIARPMENPPPAHPLSLTPKPSLILPFRSWPLSEPLPDPYRLISYYVLPSSLPPPIFWRM